MKEKEGPHASATNLSGCVHRRITERSAHHYGCLEVDWYEIEPSLEATADGNVWFDPIVLRQGVEVFQQLYLDHIVLEESLAYPEARGRIDPALLESMGREMAKRRAVRDAKAAKA